MKLSLVIPCRDVNDPKLAELLASIDSQDFPKDQMEILVITEGTSESAKAIGIRRAKGEVVGILASDNELHDEQFLSHMVQMCKVSGSAYPAHYTYMRNDDALNRYFTLIGGNDPLAFYMGKNDKLGYMPKAMIRGWKNRTIGDNGFFIRKSLIESTDLDNYYHIDNAQEAIDRFPEVVMEATIHHKTGGNLLSFFAKRYRYGLQHAFNKNRRWHLVDFKQPRDICRLLLFIFFSLTLVQPLALSIRGYLNIRDKAWFLHPVCCLLTVFIYALLVVHLLVKKMYQSLFAHMDALRA